MCLADLRDRDATVEACRGVQVVFHAGGVMGIWGPWQRYYAINSLGTQHVIDGCRQHGVGRLIHTSSPSVTFNGLDQQGVDESAPYPRRWLCHYPRSKAMAERRVLEANGRGGLLTCVLRPHLIWGPNDRHLVPPLLLRARAGKLIRVGDGTNQIDTIFVENAALAHLQAAEALTAGAAVAGRAYFLSQGEPINCWQWIGQLLASAGLPSPRKSISFRSAWRWGTVLEVVWTVLRLSGEPPMTRFLAAQLAKSHYFDIRRAQQDFGYEPKISTEEGMKRMADWLRPP